MQFTFESGAAEELARKLEKFLTSKGIVLPHDQALDALAAMQGYTDWNSLAAGFKREAIDALLQDFERVHVEANRRHTSENEGELRAHTGFALRFPLDAEGCSFVRVVDPLGRELAYWTNEEWADDPTVVMGAIIGALVRGNDRTRNANSGDAPGSHRGDTCEIAKMLAAFSHRPRDFLIDR